MSWTISNVKSGTDYYRLQVCDDCMTYHQKTGSDPRWRYNRADRGAMKKRVEGLQQRIAELEAALPL